MLRFQDPRISVYDFARTFSVRCPRCSRCADVRTADATARFSCVHCGLSRSTSSRGYVVRSDAHDWYFDLPLWLQTRCCGDVLWARNLEHLTFLESFVAAQLRERPRDALGAENKLMASRLPHFIKRGSNRRRVQASIQRLRNLAAAR
jgi:hypothetical protein